MKRLIRQLFGRRPKSARPRARVNRPGLEQLEARDLMTVGMTPYTDMQEAISGDRANTVAAARTQPAMPLVPMMQTRLFGSLPKGDVDVVRVSLTKGQVLMADMSAANVQVKVFNSQGLAVSGVASLVDNGQAALAFTAGTDGDYFIQLTSAPGTTTPFYILTLEETGLANARYDSGALNRSLLQQGNGQMYTFLNQGAIDIVGPTGYGFSLSGKWQQKTSTNSKGLVSSTYTASGVIDLNTPLGQVPIDLPSGFQLVVSTYANAFGQVAGSVSSVAVTGITTNRATPLLSASSLVTQLGQQFGLAASTPAAVPFTLGVALGSQLKDTGAPLDTAVPYLDFHIGNQLSLNYAGTEIAPTMKGSNGVSADLVIDPSDPMVYFHVAGAPGVSDLAVGVSRHGRFAFEPLNAPQQWQGSLFGHVFTNVAVNVAQLTDNEVPVAVHGSTLINLDGISSSGWQAGGAVSNMLKGNAITLLKQLQGASFGFNGQLDLALAADSKSTGTGLDLKLPAVNGTVIYNGPTNTVYFHGSQLSFFKNIPFVQNLPQWNPLHLLDKDPGTIDGAFGPKIQSVTVSGNDAANTVGWTATFDNTHVHAGFGVSAPGLGQVVSLSGDCYYNGQFKFTGTVNLNIPHVPSWAQLGSLTITATNQGIAGTLNVTLLSSTQFGGQYQLSNSIEWDAPFIGLLPLSIAGGSLKAVLAVNSNSGVSLSLTTPTWVGELADNGTVVVTDVSNGAVQSYKSVSDFVNSLSQAGNSASPDLQNIGSFLGSLIP